MQWHQGSIPEAISQAKLNGAIFLVFVSGADEQSKKMTDTLEDDEVSTKLNEKCVALKLEASGESARQFSEIYPVLVVPSTFFIGANGVPLEVIGGSLDGSQLLEKIDKVMQMHEENASRLPSSDASLSTPASDAKVLSAPEVPEVTIVSTTEVPKATVVSAPEDPEATVVSKPEVPDATIVSTLEDPTVEKASSSAANRNEEQTSGASDIGPSASLEMQNSLPSTSSNLESKPLLEERVERAKMLAKQLQEQKQAEEKEQEKQKEIERRKMGKAVHKNKQKHHEQEFKQLAEELAREKAEERAAVEKIRQQIARDRAERAAKFNAVKAEEENRKQVALQAKLKEEQERAAAAAANRSLYARLQFKLPDGSSVNHQFDAGATLQTVLNFVKETVRPPFSFHLALAFPRREFQGSDYSQTLRDLQLAPTASVLVLPVRSSAVSTKAFDTFNLVWLLLSPFLTIWRMLQTFIFGTPAQSSRHAGERSSSDASSQFGSSSLGEGSGTVSERKNQSTESNIFGRREGNIYRLPTQSGEEDDNNTWNGNSTQQQ